MSLVTMKNQIPEFDYETAMAYCGEDEEFLTEMLQDYLESGRDKTLTEYFENKDWANYEIDVHSLKTTSRVVGLSDLGDLCEKLQSAAGDGDAATIMAEHPTMMSKYCSYLKIIRASL